MHHIRYTLLAICILIGLELTGFRPLFAAVPAPVGKSFAQEEGYSGPVKYVKWESTDYEMNSGAWSPGKRTLDRQEDFDRQGFQTRNVTYAGGLIDELQQSKECDRAGRITLHRINTAATHTRWSYFYGGNNRRFKALYYSLDQNHPERVLTYAYDVKGRVSCIKEYSADRQFTASTVYHYDVRGNVSEEIGYGSDGKASYKHLYISYDGHGNPTLDTYYAAGTKNYIWRRQYSYQYDAHGSWTQQTIYNVSKHNQQITLTPHQVIYRTISYY